MTEEPTVQVLLVDDDDALREALATELRRSGFEVVAVAEGEAALKEVQSRAFDVAIVDLSLPGIRGEELIPRLRDRSPSPEVIVLTGHGSVESAVRTLKDGAYDFLTKPCNLDTLEAAIRRAFEKRSLLRNNTVLRRELERQDQFREFVGQSAALRSVLEIIDKVAQTESGVLIEGESGVGKELAARAIHRNSPRRKEPFVVVDCTSLQESLLQSELFGHERGAFTGAVTRKHGLFEVADGGTVFLDEIGEIPLQLQARILRVLDTGGFRRAGGVRTIKVNVRVICATNRDLWQMVQKQQFRGDLYYRINVMSFTLPPLRERREDVPLLVRYFTDKSPIRGRGPVRISPQFLSVLQAYSWPGNVRELQNVIERALILADGEEVTVQDLPGSLRPGRGATVGELTARKPTLAEMEQSYIAQLLEEFGGHRARVAQVLGISERSLYRKLKHLPGAGRTSNS